MEWSDVPSLAVVGGCAGTNYVLAVLVPFLISALIYVSRQYIVSLQERIKSHAEMAMLLKDAKDIIRDNNMSKRELTEVLYEFRTAVARCQKHE